MKKKLLLFTSALLLGVAPVFAESDQAKIDELIKERDEVINEFKELTDKYQKETQPLDERFNEITQELQELGVENAGLNNDNNSNSNYHEVDDYIFELLDKEVVDNNMFPDKKVLAITMNYTNNSDTPTSPWMAFSTSFSPQQNLGTTTEILMGANGQLGNVEDQEAVEIGDANVNPGETVKAIIGVQLETLDEPVQFILVSSMALGEKQGFFIALNE